MSVLFIALPIALVLGGAGMIACIYCIRGGQYDDMDTPSLRMLIEDRERPNANRPNTNGPDANRPDANRPNANRPDDSDPSLGSGEESA